MAFIFLPLSSNSRDSDGALRGTGGLAERNLFDRDVSRFLVDFPDDIFLDIRLAFSDVELPGSAEFGLATGPCHPELGSVRQNGITSPIRRNITTSGPASLQDDRGHGRRLSRFYVGVNVCYGRCRCQMIMGSLEH